MKLLPFWVYVLRSQVDGQLYVGFTSDLENRLQEHANGRVPSTAPRRPLDLLYTEGHTRREDALRRETYLKTSKGHRALRLMLPDTLADSLAAPGSIAALLGV